MTNQNNKFDTVSSSPVALSYLLDNGPGTIVNTGYLLHAISAAFVIVSNEIEFIRHKYLTKIDQTPTNFINDKTGALQEIKNTIESAYGQQGLNILSDILNNATGFPAREGRKIESRLEDLNRILMNRKHNIKESYYANDSTTNEDVSPDDIDVSSFDIKNELCPDFWDNNKLNPLARKKLLSIAKDFIDHLDIENNFIDIVLTGSIANYNWNEDYSDIDLHIIADFDELSDDPDVLKKYFDAERKIWNEEHDDISIYGYPVEIYIQDIKEKHKSTGVYSLLNDKWIKKPFDNKISDNDTDYNHVKVITSDIMNDIDELEKQLADMDDIESIHDKSCELFNSIKNIRKSGMGTNNPEMSDGNLIFKSLRRSGYI